MSDIRSINRKIEELEQQLAAFPMGYLVYKTINGKKQPYLQWKEDGKTKSSYVRSAEREEILIQLESRKNVEKQLKHLLEYREKLADSWKKYPTLKKQNSLIYPVGIGQQSFTQIRKNHLFYVDKTGFLGAWWKNHAQITLITRPRRFGKTLNLDMADCFFSIHSDNPEELFSDTQIWKDSGIRSQSGSWPVLHFSFSGIKTGNFQEQLSMILYLMQELAGNFTYLGETDPSHSWYTVRDQQRFRMLIDRLDSVSLQTHSDQDIILASLVLRLLSELLFHYHRKKVLILIDEYDTPLQEAWMKTEEEERNRETDHNMDSLSRVTGLMRLLFNQSLKSNPFLEKALLTGITRISKESMFSDLNNLEVSSVTDDLYSEYFGFTEDEVYAALDSHGYTNHTEIKKWYDGFTFGSRSDIYNPWSITNFLSSGKLKNYWINSGSSAMLGKLIAQNDLILQGKLETLLCGETITESLEEDITFRDLHQSEHAIWSLMLSSGYLKIVNQKNKDTFKKSGQKLSTEKDSGFCPETCSLNCSETYSSIDSEPNQLYALSFTNREVQSMMPNLIRSWFRKSGNALNSFAKALLISDLEHMNLFMNEIALRTISIFDCGQKPSCSSEPERFYHGFVLGLLVELRDFYLVKSNRESGYGRLDVMIIPRDFRNIPMPGKPSGYILEFKVHDPKKEDSMEMTVENALKQIEEKNYRQELIDAGVLPEQIHCYGFAFQGKKVLIGTFSG